jgi:ribose transport system ATP-binding protein
MMREDTKTEANENAILEMRSITKIFPGVKALNKVNFVLKRGEVHGLLGENGAGKSTLIKLLSGNSFPTEGEIYLDGKPFKVNNPIRAQEKGIAIIYQELNLVGELDAVENIFLGREYRRGVFVDYPKMKKLATDLMESMDMKIDMSKPVHALSIAQQQMVEIAKALSMNAKLIVMDEPTATLTSHEVENLFKIIGRLKEEGVSIILISHHLSEVFETCDGVTILKDGELVGSYDIQDLTEGKMINLMIGRDASDIYSERAAGYDRTELLRVQGFCNEYVDDVSFTLNKGEILGIAGLIGSGRTELVRAIFGADRLNKGDMYLRGEKVKIRMPKDAINRGIALLTEDRKSEGLVLGLSVRANMSLPILHEIKHGPFIDGKAEQNVVSQYIAGLKISTPGQHVTVVNLSGGNQQKVVLGKWLAANCDILILDEPTRGIDIGAKIEIYSLMRDLCGKGKSIIMVSSELPEVIGMSDRILVMRNGRIRKELDCLNTEEITEENILKYAMG